MTGVSVELNDASNFRGIQISSNYGLLEQGLAEVLDTLVAYELRDLLHRLIGFFT